MSNDRIITGEWVRWLTTVKQRIEELPGTITPEQIIGGGDLERVNDSNVTLTLTGTPTGALLKDVTLTVGWTGVLPVLRGGIGIGAVVAGDLLYAGSTGTQQLSTLGIGAAATVLTSTGTAPAWAAGEALTRINDTNVTLTLTGTPATALLAATGLTLGWTGVLSPARGGTGLGSYTTGDLLYASSSSVIAGLADVATGSVLVSGGVATAPAYSASPTLSALTLTPPVGGAVLTLADAVGGASGLWKLSATNFVFSGVNDHTFTLAYNVALVADYPLWSEAIEPRYYTGAPPNGLLEKTWAFTSLDRLTSYQPFNFNIDLNTNLAYQTWKLSEWAVVSSSGTAGTDDTIHVYTAAGSKTVAIGSSGRLHVGALGVPAYPVHITGPTIGTAALSVAPTTFAAGDLAVYIHPAAVTGDAEWIAADSSFTGVGEARFRNTGAGSSKIFAWAGSGGSAWVRTLSSQDWSFGSNRADAGKWMLCNADTLAVNQRVAVTAAGLFGIGVTSPTAILHLKAGTATASTAPLKFNSGTLMATAEAGAVEFLTDDYYATITTGAARKAFILTDGTALTSGRVPLATTNGRLTDDADLTFATDTLSATKVLAPTSVSTPSLISTGALTITPAAGSSLSVALGTTGDLMVNTNQLYVDTSAAAVGVGTASPTARLHLAAGTATANTAPLKLTSGTSLTSAEAGAIEFTTDDYFATITTGAARKAFVLDDGTRLTSGKIPIATTNGRLTDGQTPLSGAKVYYVSDSSGGAVTRKLTFTDGILTAET